MMNGGFKVKIMRDMKGFLNVEQINKIIKAEPKARNRLILMVLAMSGRRVGEARLLKEENIDYSNELIYWDIFKRKDIKNLWIRANRGLLITIKQYCKLKGILPNEYVFKSGYNEGLRPINRHTIYRIVRRAGARVGIIRVGDKTIHPHHFRHSFAIHGVRKIKNAGDLRLLQMLMGHAGIETTAYYLQFAQKELEPLVNDMPDFTNWDKDKAREVLQKLVKRDDDLLTMGKIDDDLKDDLKKANVGEVMNEVNTKL